VTLDLNEAALSTAGATGSNPSLTSEVDNTPALSFTAGSDNLTSFAFTSTAGLVTDLNGTGGQDIFWQLVSPTQIKGFLDAGHTQLAVTLDLVAPDSIAAGATGNVTVTAILSDNLQHVLGNGAQISSIGNVGVVATDTDGDTTTGTVNINVQDDVPTAVADIDSVAAGTPGPATGNVLTGGTDALDSNTTDGVADVPGADGAVVSGVAAGTTNADLDNAATLNTAIQGSFGKLTLAVNGSYSYTRDPGTAGGVNDVFTYTIKDGDGDLSHTTLTISIGDSTPSDVIPAAGGATTTVLERGLPARGPEPAGSGEIADGNPTNNSDPSETVSGAIAFTSLDGVSVVSLGGHVLTGAPQTFADGTTGTLTASFTYDAATGAGGISYSYTLIDNTLVDPSSSSSFAVVVTDADGDNAPAGNLVISIVDNVPTAVADIDSVAAGTPGPATGNVLTGGTDALDSNTTDGVADVPGADGAVVSGVAAGTTNADLDNAATLNTAIQGSFGKLTLAVNGSYSYTRDPGTAGGVNDVFTYTIKDGDGDLSHTTLTISIGNSTPTITGLTPAAGGGDVTVNEDDLLASRGVGESAGSDISKESLTQAGTFTISSPDGIKSLTIDGHTVISNGVFTATSFTTSTLSNTLSVTGYNAATGVVSYSYTLLDNETHAPGAGTNSLFENLAVALTDQDNQTANDTLVATIIDDVPTAVADIDSVAAGTPGPATGNVLTGGTDALDSNTTDGVADVPGADGAVVSGVAAGTTNADLDNAATLNTAIQGSFGKLTLAVNGSYSYTRDPGTAGGVNDVFTYTIKDGDGDLSHTTLTISIGNSTPTITGLTPAAGGGDVTVNEDDLLASRGVGESAGSDISKESLTQAGTFTISSPDGIKSLTIDGHTVISNGVFTATSFTTSTLSNTLSVTGYNAATGVVSYSYTLLDNETHAPGAGTNSLFENLAVALTDQDNQTANDTLVATIIDDVPTAVVPDHAELLNVAGNPFPFSLDNDLTLSNNFGADGGTVVFLPSLNGTPSGLTSHGTSIIYNVSPDGHTLTGVAGPTTVFVITLDPATATYSVDMNDVVDSTTRVDFDAGAFNFVGGNNEWAEFIPVGETVGTPIDNNSSDLLLTPQINHQFASSINSNNGSGGVGTGGNVGSSADPPRRFCNGSSGQSCKYGPGRLWCLEQAGSCF
jgi:VCBS repeat-containing protein